jgi:hypothetical protein
MGRGEARVKVRRINRTNSRKFVSREERERKYWIQTASGLNGFKLYGL